MTALGQNEMFGLTTSGADISQAAAAAWDEDRARSREFANSPPPSGAVCGGSFLPGPACSVVRCSSRLSIVDD